MPPYGRRVLNTLEETRSPEIMQLFLADHRPIPKEMLDSTFCQWWDAEDINVAMIQVFLDSPRFDFEAKSEMLIEAVEDENLSHDTRRVELLLRDSRPIDQEALDGAIFAAVPTNCALLKLLLRNGRGNPCASGNCVILRAVQNRSYDCVRLLLADKGADPTMNDFETLAFACRVGDLEMVHVLLEDPRVQRFIAGKEFWPRFRFVY